ncbi:hypothetical protein OIU74_029227 [Salix koriyanagi]|uniref:Uncharacterized protein n=1 Tax=Salix koriyanagi TaxID=2511006 RepID=A0A9Q0VDU7_9ROSI|nr:hypothetical protein OIU74_029227 [Salix koriyanagi]
MAGKLLVDLFVAALTLHARMKVLRYLIELVVEGEGSQ